MKPLVIGVAGGTGSGKSTVARNVAAALGDASIAFIDMDAYYLDHGHLSFEERRKVLAGMPAPGAKLSGSRPGVMRPPGETFHSAPITDSETT